MSHRAHVFVCVVATPVLWNCAAGVFALLFILVLSYFTVSHRYRVAITKRFERKAQEVLNFSDIVRSLKIHGVRREPRELPKESLKFSTDDDATLGSGGFGCVTKALLTHEEFREVKGVVCVSAFILFTHGFLIVDCMYPSSAHWRR